MPGELSKPGEGDDFCQNGSHYLRDGSAHTYVKVGPCEQLHTDDEDLPKLQVIKAAQSAVNGNSIGTPQDAAAFEKGFNGR